MTSAMRRRAYILLQLERIKFSEALSNLFSAWKLKSPAINRLSESVTYIKCVYHWRLTGTGIQISLIFSSMICFPLHELFCIFCDLL